jgi:hypothetical protein
MKHIIALLLLLTGCSALTPQQVDTAQDAVDTAAALCTNQLLRSDTRRMLLESGMAPVEATATIQTACAVLAASKPGIDALLDQAAQARTTPARMLQAEARRRGLL